MNRYDLIIIGGGSRQGLQQRFLRRKRGLTTC